MQVEVSRLKVGLDAGFLVFQKELILCCAYRESLMSAL
jgi:hypothetical protein